ncbi:hypothetical protein GCM10027082_06890 [Comamonas humi]
MSLFNPDFPPDAFEVRVSELLVATPEGSDAMLHGAIPEILRLLREHLKMDVAFVSEFVDGRRVFRRVDTAPDKRVIETGGSAPLESSYCHFILKGVVPRLIHDAAKLPPAQAGVLPSAPFPIGAHLSTPVVLNDGRIYGTLCCFSFAPNDALMERDLHKLEMSAKVVARKIDEQRAQDAEQAMARWELQPTAAPRGLQR